MGIMIIGKAKLETNIYSNILDFITWVILFFIVIISDYTYGTS